MKTSVISILVFTTLLTGCTLTPVKQTNSVIVGPGTFYAKWQKQVLNACSDKAAEVVLKLTADKYREGILLTEEQIVMIHGMLVRKCSMNSGLVI
jgi:hypothetical protein